MILDSMTVDSNDQISPGIYKIIFNAKREMTDITPGQFINVYPNNPRLTLPRPLSICDASNGQLTVVYKAVGSGTREFSYYETGESVKIMYPLGNGFDISRASENAVIIGGGVGTPPLLMLAKALKTRGIKVFAYLGFENEPILIDEFEKTIDELYVSTDTGCFGVKGNVVDLLKKNSKNASFFACGPAPMLKAVCGYMAEKGREGQISLEERMACGFGACVGCAVKITTKSDWTYMKVCKDGPVFDYREVLWD